ncbi:Mitochondrial tRNA-specific 2-thiouridylase 1 [Anthophora plagiata]
MFKKVVVGISGGVDSAVAALLLKRKGFKVTGVFMKNWDIADETGTCQTQEDYKHAQWVCKKLEIPLVEVNFVKEYWNNVFSYLTEEYENGHTPNPDILCNKYIKFDEFFKFARKELQADAIATGHYVKTSFGPYLEHFKPNTNVRLLQGDDTVKDQTFFLSQVPQEALRYSMFPIGEHLKTNVKQIAHESKLDLILHKKESMGICFVGKRNFQDFISQYIPNKPGYLIDLDSGQVVGKHKGFHHWTIGQRVKLGSFPAAFYVYKKDIRSNNIIVVCRNNYIPINHFIETKYLRKLLLTLKVQGTNHPALYTDFIVTNTPHWISSEPSEFSNFGKLLCCDFRFQHRDPLVPCTVHKTLKNQLVIQISQPLRALTDGQFAILYKERECLGSAAITFSGPSYYSLKQEVEIKEEHDQKCDLKEKMASTST